MISVVYIVQIGKHAKIGYSTNLPQRLKALQTGTAEDIRVLAAFPGGREEETRLHRSLSETRLSKGEFFWLEYRLDIFVEIVNDGDIARAWRWLDETHPDRRKAKKQEEATRRVAERRKSRAELNAYFAGLVSERKRTLGW